MKRLIEYFIKYPVSGNVIIFLLLALGYFGFISLKSTTMPQTDPGSIIVTAQYPSNLPGIFCVVRLPDSEINPTSNSPSILRYSF